MRQVEKHEGTYRGGEDSCAEAQIAAPAYLSINSGEVQAVPHSGLASVVIYLPVVRASSQMLGSHFLTF